MSYSTVLGFVHEGAPYVSGLVHLPGLGLGGNVCFQVDTGASGTTLCPADAERLGIDFSQLPLPCFHGTVGGPVLVHLVECVLTLTAYDEVTHYRLKIAVMNPSTSSSECSLLGRDVLSRCSLLADANEVGLLPVSPDSWLERNTAE